MSENQLKVGDKLFAMISPYYGKKAVLNELEITRVGKKFYYAGQRDYKINKDTLACENPNYSQWSFQCCRSEQEITDMIEQRRKSQAVYDFFRELKSLTPVQIDLIYNIINPSNHD